jgi:glucose/arabinose dehydrogenase
MLFEHFPEDQHVRKTGIFPLVAALAAAPAIPQDEQIPTAKLDRISVQPAFAGQTQAPMAETSRYSVSVVASGLSAPWALAFLPDGDILVNEYTGGMRIVGDDGSLSVPLDGLPEISREGWAGLFDLALDPGFESNDLLYFSYTAPSGNAESPNIPRVARAILNRKDHRLDDVTVIVDGFGGQELHFAPDGTLLVSGAGDSSVDNPQDPAVSVGKLLRINSDGSIPADNPWAGRELARQEVLSVGHRDVSGMATHPETGDIWITEHGPRGGDELNRIIPGANYGWKEISYGTNYNGDPVGNGSGSREGMEQPKYFWRPSIAPSGLTFYDGDLFPEWRNNVFVTALSGQHITRLVLDGDRVIGEERMLVDRAERIRELRVGPDGALYALTNEEGDAPKGNAALLRIAPLGGDHPGG